MPDRFLGQRLGEFVAEERIGRGAMATVYRAFQPSVQRHVALKVITINAGIGEDDEFRLRFAQEAEVVAGLEHIHILPIYDYGIVNDEFAFIAMRLLLGGTLHDLMSEGPLPLERSVEIITQVARGLAHAHRAGVVHRDLKPSNILFDASGNAYLTDFGLAKVLTMPELTKPGLLVGTPAYVSPEALRGQLVDHRADIYSLGVLSYQMLTGRLPFESQSANILALIRMHLEDEPPKLRDVNPAVPQEVEAVVLKALRKNPEDRFQSTEEFAQALNTALGKHFTLGSYPALRLPIQAPAALRKRLKNPRFVAAAFAVVAGAMIGLGLLLGAWERANWHPPKATILGGVRGVAADVIPTTNDLNVAKRVLGDSGFIAFIACSLDSEFQATRAREMNDFAAEYGVAYRVYDSEGDGHRQVSQIERARLDGATAFIICPLDSDLLTPALEALQQAAIPVVFITLYKPGYGLMLDSDNYATGLAAGRLAGEIIRDEMGGQADVVILGFPGFPSSELRAEGMRDGVLENAPDANILGVYQGFMRDSARESIQQLLDEGTHIDVIVSINDAGSFGAIDALQAAGIGPDEVAISSVNAEALALDYIGKGNYLRGSVRIDRETGSHIALDGAIRMLAGAALPETIIFPPGEMVTRESLAVGEQVSAS
jgi:ABC-type sugar transport system substrate-binding protein